MPDLVQNSVVEILEFTRFKTIPWKIFIFDTWGKLDMTLRAFHIRFYWKNKQNKAVKDNKTRLKDRTVLFKWLLLVFQRIQTFKYSESTCIKKISSPDTAWECWSWSCWFKSYVTFSHLDVSSAKRWNLMSTYMKRVKKQICILEATWPADSFKGSSLLRPNESSGGVLQPEQHLHNENLLITLRLNTEASVCKLLYQISV